MAKRSRATGGRNGYEPRARVLTRQARAWELSIAGWTQRQIARELGVSQPAVKKMLDRVGREMMRDLRSSTDRHIGQIISGLDAVDREVAAAWEQSKTERTRRRHQRIESGAGVTDPSGIKTVVEAEATTREGDPRYSAQRLRVLQEKRAIIDRVTPSARPETDGDEPSTDPYASVKRKLANMPTSELITLNNIKSKTMAWLPGACEIFESLTADELIALATIKRKWDDGTYDADESDEVL
jgi:predicted transcriptional regulator